MDPNCLRLLYLYDKYVELYILLYKFLHILEYVQNNIFPIISKNHLDINMKYNIIFKY